jgi:nucleotide-binding universal stress UspA family protein
MDGPVVIGVDDFENSAALISAAVREAQDRQAPLWLAHVYSGFAAPATPGISPGYAPEELLRENAVAQLDAMAERLRSAVGPTLRVETLPLSGPPAHALTDAAGACGASLLVVGGRGRGGFTGQLLGSVSLRVLTLAHCPVLVVRGDTDPGTQRVMIGVDLDDPASGPGMIAFAFEEAARRGADVYAFNAWEDPTYLYVSAGEAILRERRAAVLDDRRERLDALLEPWKEKYPELVVTSEVLAGSPARLLVESTDLVDLLVVGGKVREKGHDGMRIGALTHTVLHHAHCPVAIVPEH